MPETPEDPARDPGLPPLALSALYLAAVVLPIGLLTLSVGRGADAWVRAGLAAGVAAMAMTLMQMVSSGRFERLSGRLGIDVTMAFHKWAAPVALLFAVLHPLLLVGPPQTDRPNRFANHLDLVFRAEGFGDARAALALLAVIVLLALFRDRLPFRYEIWRATHALGAVALVVLMLVHVRTDGRSADGWGGFFWIGLTVAVLAPAFWVYLRRLWPGAGNGWHVAGLRKVADRLWEVTLAAPQGRALRFRAGQFAWLAFGRHRLPLFDHPFSIASPPSEATTPRFLIQEAGDFTRGIGALEPGTRVGIDAPHGRFVLHPAAGDAVLLVAGGVGIAPILSVLADLAARGNRRAIRLVYAAREPAAMVEDRLWRPALAAVGGQAFLIADRPGAGMEQGPLCVDHLRAALEGLDPGRTQAMICGPGPMMTLAADALLRLGLPPHAIAYERFQYDTRDISARDRRVLAGFAGLWLVIALAVAGFASL